MTDQQNEKTIRLYRYYGRSKKNGNEYFCLRLQVGDWNTVIFPKSNFERKYLENLVEDFEDDRAN